MPIEPIAPPPVKSASTVELTAADTVAATAKAADTAAAATKAADTAAATAKQEAREIGKKQPQRSRISEIAAKLEAAASGKSSSPAASQTVKIEPMRDEGVAAPKDETAAAPKKDDAIPSGDKELDAEIETETKDLSPAQKKAFAHKTYALRDAKRKLAAADEAGKNTAGLQAKLTKAETELADFQAKAAQPSVEMKEFEELKTRAEASAKRAQELEQELQVAAVERSAEFQAAITKPKKTIEDAVKVLAKKHELPERQLLNALYAGEDEQATAIETLTDAEKVRFFNYSLKLSEIDDRAEVLRVNAAEANQKIAAKREQETKSQAESRKAAFAQAHTQNWKTLTEAVPVLKPGEGDDDVTKNWNAAYETAEQSSRTTDFNALEPARQSEVLQRASVFPLIVGALQSKETEITGLNTKLTEANEALDKFRANKPGAEATANEDAAPVKPQGTMAERVGKRVAQLAGR